MQHTRCKTAEKILSTSCGQGLPESSKNDICSILRAPNLTNLKHRKRQEIYMHRQKLHVGRRFSAIFKLRNSHITMNDDLYL